MIEYTGDLQHHLLAGAKKCLECWDEPVTLRQAYLDAYNSSIWGDDYRIPELIADVIRPVLAVLDWAVDDWHEVTTLKGEDGLPFGYLVSSFGQRHFYLRIFPRGAMDDDTLRDAYWNTELRAWWTERCDYAAKCGAKWSVLTNGDYWLLTDLSVPYDGSLRGVLKTQLTKCGSPQDFLRVVGVLSRERAAASIDSLTDADLRFGFEPVPLNDLDEHVFEHAFDVRVRSVLYTLLDRRDERFIDLIKGTAPSLRDDKDSIARSLKLIKFDLLRGAIAGAQRRRAERSEERWHTWLMDTLGVNPETPWLLPNEEQPNTTVLAHERLERSIPVSPDLATLLPLDWEEHPEPEDLAKWAEYEVAQGSTPYPDCAVYLSSSSLALSDEYTESPIDKQAVAQEDEFQNALQEYTDADWEADQAVLEMADFLNDIHDSEFTWQLFHDDDPADYAVEERSHDWIDDFNLGDPYRGI